MKQKNRFLSLLGIMLMMLPGINAEASKNCPNIGTKLTPEEYCQRYARLAVEQMHKHGVPASITLAQGMLESSFGSSYIAVMGNNHFGIKAYTRNFSGPSISCDDDKKNEPFCTFETVEDGFEFHSQFLHFNTRYAPLFNLSIYDYKGWANGLKNCNYATDPQYATKLISTIERYGLAVYDHYSLRDVTAPVPAVSPEGIHTLYKTKPTKGLVFIICREGDDLYSIGREFGIKESKLRRNNDLGKNHVLHDGDIIYLQNKHNKADLPNEYHTVKEGESLWSISQQYGVTVKSLTRRNKLKSLVVTKGQVLKLR